MTEIFEFQKIIRIKLKYRTIFFDKIKKISERRRRRIKSYFDKKNQKNKKVRVAFFPQEFIYRM